MNTVILIAAAVAGLGLLGFWILRRRPKHQQCARCKNPAPYGYSKAAESDLKDIVQLCRSCLIAALQEDYTRYTHRAAVVQPVGGLPCYVFRPRGDWSKELQNELDSILAKLGSSCSSCGSPAHYLWFDCALDPGSAAEIPERGLRQTLSSQASSPAPQCGTCCVKRISQALQKQAVGYLEICGPHGDHEGLVIAMGY